MKRLLLSLALTALVPGSAHSASIYSVTELGTLGGDFTAAYGVNDAGQVTGLSTTSDGQSHAFITGPNGIGMTELDGLKGLAIDASGQVIFGDGTSFFVTGPNGAGVTPLGNTDPNALGFSGSFAYGFGTVNASGQVAGTRDSQGNILTDGPTINGPTNNGDTGSHAYVTGPNGVGITDLGTLGGSDSFARGVNTSGQVVGGSNLANTTWNNLDAPFTVRRATLWSGGRIFDLTTLLDPTDAFVLSTESFTLDTAVGINDEGQIVADGFGYLLDGMFFNEAFLLTPESPVNAIPEPSSIVILGGALICLCLLARLKRRSYARTKPPAAYRLYYFDRPQLPNLDNSRRRLMTPQNFAQLIDWTHHLGFVAGVTNYSPCAKPPEAAIVGCGMSRLVVRSTR